MPAPQGRQDSMELVKSFKEALKGRVGADRYRMWFTHGVTFSVQTSSEFQEPGLDPERGCNDPQQGCNDKRIANTTDLSDSVEFDEKKLASDKAGTLVVSVRGQFALDRVRNHFLNHIRGAAMQALGCRTDVRICLEEITARQVPLPLNDSDSNVLSDSLNLAEDQFGVLRLDAGHAGSPKETCGDSSSLDRTGDPSVVTPLTVSDAAQASKRTQKHRRSAKSFSQLIQEGAASASTSASSTVSGGPQKLDRRESNLFSQPLLLPSELSCDGTSDHHSKQANRSQELGSQRTVMPSTGKATAVGRRATELAEVPAAARRAGRSDK